MTPIRPLVDKLWKTVLDLFWPVRCVSCKKFGSWICDDCISKIDYPDHLLCIRCQKPSLGGFTHPRCQNPLGIERLIFSVSYQGPVRKIISGLKYKNLTPLTSLMTNLITEDFNFRGITLPQDFLLIPVPLHWFKERERGFNQAEALAKALGEKLDLKVRRNLLSRTKYTDSQTGLSKKKRRENVRGAFKVVDKKKVKGQKIILIDDVCTTGATLEACCQILKRNGARAIWALTFAKD